MDREMDSPEAVRGGQCLKERVSKGLDQLGTGNWH